jgi:endonuclease YncB( thermonuclease family)
MITGELIALGIGTSAVLIALWRVARPRARVARPRAKGPVTRIPPTIRGRAYVIDGDTIVVRRIKVRLKAIDAPELSDYGGLKAKWHMVRLTKGRTVTCECTGERSYDRLVAYCSTSAGDPGADDDRRRARQTDQPL